MPKINDMRLRGLDLNLLVTLRVLLEEKHVTRSADRLGMTQPALSSALGRLRAVFGDPLLVRNAGKLTMTPRAEALFAGLQRVLVDIENIFDLPLEFVPSETTRTFTLIGTDYVENFVIPRVMAELSKVAPGARLNYKPPNLKRLELLLGEGHLDLAIGYLPQAPSNLYTRPLFEERFSCIVRRDNPCLGDAGVLSLAQFLEMGHVQVAASESTIYTAPIDHALAALGRTRKVIATHPNFMPVLAVVASTDLVATIPRRMAELAAAIYPVTVFEPPLTLSPIEISMYWHERNQRDDGHKWLRELILSLFKSDKSSRLGFQAA